MATKSSPVLHIYCSSINIQNGGDVPLWSSVHQEYLGCSYLCKIAMNQWELSIRGAGVTTHFLWTHLEATSLLFRYKRTLRIGESEVWSGRPHTSSFGKIETGFEKWEQTKLKINMEMYTDWVLTNTFQNNEFFRNWKSVVNEYTS